MKEKIERLRQEIENAMQQTQTGRALYELKVRFQTELKGVMSGMKDLPKEDRPAFGKIVNEFKQAMEEKFDARALVVRKMEMQEKYQNEQIDITMPGRTYKSGALHPITLSTFLQAWALRYLKVRKSKRIIIISRHSTLPKTTLQGICKTRSIWRIISYFVRKRRQVKSASWKNKPRRLKYSPPVEYSVRTTTPPIRPCFIKWRGLW